MRSFFKNLFYQLELEDFSESKPVHRSADFLDEMCHAFNGIQTRLIYLQSEWEAAKSLDEDISTYAIEREDTAGLVIKISDASQENYCHYLMDYVKGSLQQQGYLLQVNKHTAKRISGATNDCWHYFLKPKPSFDDDGKYQQRFGNVIVETIKDAKGALQFKLQCNYYAGFNYSKPIPFGEFLAHL